MIPIYPEIEPITIEPAEDGKIHVEVTFPDIEIFPVDISVPLAASPPFFYHYRVVQLFFTQVFYYQTFWTQDFRAGAPNGDQWLEYTTQENQYRLFNAQFLNVQLSCPYPPDAFWDYIERQAYPDPNQVNQFPPDIFISLPPFHRDDGKTLMGSGSGETYFANPRFRFLAPPPYPMSIYLWLSGSNFFEDLHVGVQTLRLATWKSSGRKTNSSIPILAALGLLGSMCIGGVAPVRTRRR